MRVGEMEDDTRVGGMEDDTRVGEMEGVDGEERNKEDEKKGEEVEAV